MDPLPVPWSVYSSALEGMDLPDGFFSQTDSFLDALTTVNASLNLISFSTREELCRHVVDALHVLHVAPVFNSPPPAADGAPAPTGQPRWIDVGTGGGFPGVPLAIARPHWSMTLLDSLRKKQSAVSSLLESARVFNGRALCGRAEELARETGHRESYDVALCRAVGRLSTVLELTLPLLKVGGAALLHRGGDGNEELAAAGQAMKTLGGRLGPVHFYRLPGLDKVRSIICVYKSDQTSPAFPRRAGIPAKKPL